MDQLCATAAQFGVEMGKRTQTYNSRLAQELGLWAETQGLGHSFHMAVFKAYFADGKNIALKPVLLDLADQVGLDRSEAAAVIDTRAYGAAVDADWALSKSARIRAVPTFRMGKEILVGAKPYERLQALVEKHLAV